MNTKHIQRVQKKTQILIKKKKYLSTTLIGQANIKDSNLINDPTIPNRFIFIGTNPTNYIKIGNEIGKIISVEPYGSIKVILQNAFNSTFDSSSNSPNINTISSWENSKIYNIFNNAYSSLVKSHFEQEKIYMAVIYNNDSTESYFGLPSLEDYLKASANIPKSSSPYCNLSDTTNYSINDAFDKCRTNNCLNSETCTWTSTRYSGI